MATKDGGAVSWKAPEYIYYSKTADWYWSLLVITLALVVTGVLMGNFLFVVLVLVGALALALYGARHPKTIHVVVSGQGVQIDDRIFPYETLQSFWIFYRPGGLKELSLRSEKMLAPYIKIPIGDANPTEIRGRLLEFLPEEAQEESLIETIARYLRF